MTFNQGVTGSRPVRPTTRFKSKNSNSVASHVTSRGKDRHRAWQIVRGCAERAGIPDLVNPETGRVRGVSPHRLRDAFGVHAMKVDDSGDGLRLLQEHLGHTSFNTTAKYRKIAGEEHHEWYERLWAKMANSLIEQNKRLVYRITEEEGSSYNRKSTQI